MTRPTLLRAIARTQVVLTALSCLLLATVTVSGGAILLRRDQDALLRTLARGSCATILEERDQPGGSFDRAMRTIAHMDLADARIEIIDVSGARLGAAGSPSPYPEDHVMEPDAGECTSTGSPLPWSGAPPRRACAVRCDESVSVRAVGDDALAAPGVRAGMLVLVIAFPVAVLVAAFAARRLARRSLQPLLDLQTAVNALDVGHATPISTPARHAEIADLSRAVNGLVERLARALEHERRFAQEASHELRTPLTVLRARIEAMTRRGDLPTELKDDAAALLKDAASLARLVDDLLLLSRSESAPVGDAVVNLCDVARQVALRQRSIDPSGAGAITVDAPDEVLVRGSEELLAMSLASLVDNARKHGGAAASVSIRVTTSGDRAHVDVEDDGPGIPDGMSELIFERFFRAPRDRARTQGVGLGLAVVKAVVERHGGTIGAERSPHGGAHVKLTLPANALG